MQYKFPSEPSSEEVLVAVQLSLSQVCALPAAAALLRE